MLKTPPLASPRLPFFSLRILPTQGGIYKVIRAGWIRRAKKAREAAQPRADFP